MASSLVSFWRCMFAPKLIKLYGSAPVEKLYLPSSLEKWGDQIIQSLYMMWKIGIYTSPFIIGILYRRGYFTNGTEGLITLTKFVTGLGVILVISYAIRAFGRSGNPMYQEFMDVLQRANTNLTAAYKRDLSRYEFDFTAWPVEFSGEDVLAIEGDRYEHRVYINRPHHHRNPLQAVTSLPCHVLGYVAIHTFGIRLVYPGSLGLLQLVLQQGLLAGRSKLVEVNHAARHKLRTRDGNDIDTMFVDKRNVTVNGNILVICCEGNAGFYEMGIMGTPIEAGYSVLGWNHPGFGGSTGAPYPPQEQNAIEIVMQFAMYKLQFPVENILLFGWSIGGYSSTWAAMNFPNVKGVILDASFDDIMPLALNHMPGWAESVVRLAVREYVNLNNYEQLSKYSGPVLLIRRTEDEVIAITENEISSNRGNYLLTKLLRYRYPQIFTEDVLKLIDEYLALNSTVSQDSFIVPFSINADICRQQLETYISEHSKTYPLLIGDTMTLERKQQLGLYLIRKHLRDYKSSHCTPLPVDMFQIPWDITIETDYVMP